MSVELCVVLAVGQQKREGTKKEDQLLIAETDSKQDAMQTTE